MTHVLQKLLWMAAFALLGRTGHAGVPDEVAPLTSARDSSLGHFENGIKLFEDRNYVGALAEFEAAYRAYPSAASLQNVALCQKQLYRYSEARDTLLRLLELHREQLSPSEKRTVEDAAQELRALVGSVHLTVVPASARLVLDGRSLTPADLEHSLSLDVGEHRITAEAEGYAPFSRSFRVAGGQQDVALDVQLIETTGSLEVTAPDAQTAIAIDGRPVGYETWTGRLTPGRHVVQIYKEGFEPYEEEVELELGDHLRVTGELGEPLEAAPNTRRVATVTGKRPQQGFYGLGTGSLLTLRGQPHRFVASSDYDPGLELGLRAGYRISTLLGFEATVSSASFAVQGNCQAIEPSACPTTALRTYHLDTHRIGFGARLMSRDEQLRLVSGAVIGIAAQEFRAFGNHASGVGPFAQLELGASLNYRHTLWEFVALGSFIGNANVQSNGFAPYQDETTQEWFGLMVRGGWGEWQPARKVPPMPQAPVKPAAGQPLPAPPSIAPPPRPRLPAEAS